MKNTDNSTKTNADDFDPDTLGHFEMFVNYQKQYIEAVKAKYEGMKTSTALQVQNPGYDYSDFTFTFETQPKRKSVRRETTGSLQAELSRIGKMFKSDIVGATKNNLEEAIAFLKGSSQYDPQVDYEGLLEEYKKKFSLTSNLM